MKKRVEIWLLGAAAVMLMGCKDHDEIVGSGDSVRVELAYTLSPSVSGGSTRQADELVQNSSKRQPNSLYVIALQGDNPMNSDVIWEEPVSKSGAGENPASVLYHSHYCDMASGVNRCLVYGDVASTPSDDISPKVYNGSLIKSSVNSVTTRNDLRNMSFYLESIYGTEVPENATLLATALTEVANLPDWAGSDNDILKNLRQNFLNHGFNLPGSAVSVKKWLESLASAAQSYHDNQSGLTDSEKTILEGIDNAATTAAGNININDVNHPPYPRNLYLPDGAAALRWVESESEFQPQMQTTTLDNINSVSRFAYPATLYYFVDSKIKTSDSKVDYYSKNYEGVSTSETKTAWDKVLESFEYDESSIEPNTKAVAIKEPVQYAVAQLHVTLKASPTEENGTTINDDAEAPITIGTSDFKLTGVIVCGQRPVNYLFEQDSNSDVDVKFIYDSQVNDCYLTTAETDACNTLVLQSFNGEDVNIILEFENKGAQTFKCVDGYVYPGTRFYLVGKVDHSNPTSGSDAINSGRVFTKDYITTVNMVVTSLAKAYNVLPNLLSSNLEIGVQTNPEWIAVTPSVVRME